MSKTNRFFAKLGRGFKKVGKKVEGTYDNAADSVRAKGLEIRIDEQYENLGRVVYRDLHTEEDLEEERRKLRLTLRGAEDRISMTISDVREEDDHYTLPRALVVGDRVFVTKVGKEGVYEVKHEYVDVTHLL